MKKLVINGLILLIVVVVFAAITVGLLKNVAKPGDLAEETANDVNDAAGSMDLAGNAVDVKEQTSVNIVDKEETEKNEFSLDLAKLDKLDSLT